MPEWFAKAATIIMVSALLSVFVAACAFIVSIMVGGMR